MSHDRPIATSSERFRGRFCPKPFENLTIDPDGGIRVCCADWLPMQIGNVHHDRLDAAWNSPAAQEIRASILDGSFRYCDANTCPALVQNALPRRDEAAAHRFNIDTGRTLLPHGPRSIGFGYDNTCNLACPTCRSDLIVLRGDALAEAERVQREVEQLLPDAEFLLITGTGDALASRLYRSFLRTFEAERWPRIRIGLMTNGLLFTPRMWDSFRSAHASISGISISVDAATPETYAVNRGGDFGRLSRNLSFAGRLLAEGQLDWFELSFVVQRNNFREIPDFVRFGFAVGASGILFQRLVHWAGTLSRQAYLEAAVHRPEHPDHEQLRTILATDVLQDPRVDLSNLAGLAAAATVPCQKPR